MISSLLFAFLMFIFFCLKFAYRLSTGTLYNQSRMFPSGITVFRDLTNHHGGNFYRPSRYHLRYFSHDQNTQVDVRMYSRPRLEIRINHRFPYHLDFHRVPRFLFAFLDAFFSPELKIENHPYFLVTSSVQTLQDLKNSSGFSRIFQQVNSGRFSVRIDERGLRMSKTLSPQDLNEFSLLEYMRLARTLTDVCINRWMEIPVQAVPSQEKCAYCKESIEENVLVRCCAVCKTPHHSDCFALNGRCAVFGCNSDRFVEPPVAVTV